MARRIELHPGKSEGVDGPVQMEYVLWGATEVCRRIMRVFRQIFQLRPIRLTLGERPRHYWYFVFEGSGSEPQGLILVDSSSWRVVAHQVGQGRYHVGHESCPGHARYETCSEGCGLQLYVAHLAGGYSQLRLRLVRTGPLACAHKIEMTPLSQCPGVLLEATRAAAADVDVGATKLRSMTPQQWSAILHGDAWAPLVLRDAATAGERGYFIPGVLTVPSSGSTRMPPMILFRGNENSERVRVLSPEVGRLAARAFDLTETMRNYADILGFKGYRLVRAGDCYA